MQVLIESGNEVLLKQHCQRPNHLAFFDIDMGGDEFGVFSAVMTEALHAVEHGMMEHFLEILFQHTLSKKGARQLDNLVKSFCRLPRQHALDGHP